MAASTSKNDKRKYYHFHRDHGLIENCIHLKEEIEHLLMMEFLIKNMKNDRGKEKVGDRPPSRVEVINVISEG